MTRSTDSFVLTSLLNGKSFQAREIRRVIKLSLIYLAITTALLGIFYHMMLDRVIKGAAPLLFVSEDTQLINETLPSLSSVLGNWLLVMMAINVVLTIVLGIYITRKLGAPLMAIKRALREMGAGNLDVKLRESDKKEFGELAMELTQALRSVREQIAAAKSEIEAADRASHGDSNLEEFDQALRNCKLALDYFQVDTENTAKAA
ncbi:MAG: methyl-accepting chemotaxis protein [Gammaproteobacteria bacterium]|nr:methyl-accepting chemotaxis protein [Gammaproteobacteria bacterium]